ncbi:tyrosine-type recombinase/integrase [Streptomyces sp. NPDC057910]|uniref:tyrosine-type recombinase/integrase n=1 Tax=Streptomyces sp. NPDC057910 TaxID=3346278 RepID=UPI0036EF33CE
MRYEEAEADAARADKPGQGHRADLAAETLPVLRTEDFLRLAEDETVPVAHRALWALMWEGGLRLGDALSLDVRDVDPERHTVDVESPKKESDERTIPLSDQTAALARAAMGDRDEGPLLTNERGVALSREAAARFARLAAPGVHAFRAGGYKARDGKKPPRIKVQTLSPGTEGKMAPDASPCQCLCAHVHLWRPDVCEGAANVALLVDVTMESPMSGEVEDRRLRPFCRGCYDAVVAHATAKRN